MSNKMPKTFREELYECLKTLIPFAHLIDDVQNKLELRSKEDKTLKERLSKCENRLDKLE